MNAFAQAQQAYSTRKSPLRSGRSAEIELLTQITARLRACHGRNVPFPRLAEVLHENRVMWTHFATSVADKENGLPVDLRARLFYLAEFTDHHTKRVLAKEAGIVPLVEINMAVLRGLCHKGES